MDKRTLDRLGKLVFGIAGVKYNKNNRLIHGKTKKKNTYYAKKFAKKD